MGSPDFAAKSLEKLVEDGHHVVGVVTTPDRKKGRGQKTAESAVKTSAIQLNIPVFQPTNMKDEKFLEEMNSLELDLGVVVAFRMLPEKLWNMPKLGTINLHASLLPNYRGAAPINWAIIKGERETGLTTFFLKHEIDTGDIILRERVGIGEETTAGELHDELMVKGAKLLSQSVALIQDGTYQTTSQTELKKESGHLNKAPKIFKEDCRINWNQKADTIINFIRGLSPYPTAWSVFLTNSGKEYTFKIFRAKDSGISVEQNDSQKVLVKDGELCIGATDRYVLITELQLEGKKRMATREFLKGFNIQETTVI